MSIGQDYGNKRIGIIGGGPAGLAAAVTAGSILKSSGGLSRWQIDLMEKKDETGRKLLATGNGKCNITNEAAEGYNLVREFFDDLGILFTKEEDGRIYPNGKQAKVVRDVLFETALKNGVNILCKTAVKSVEKTDGGFVVVHPNGSPHEYEKLIITTGGKAGIQYGSEGDGFKFARTLGLEVKPILPALVPMTYGDNGKFDLKQLKGVRAVAKLTLVADDTEVAAESGELQFTDYGISGICTFDLSRHLARIVRKNRDSATDCKVIIDFLADLSLEEVTLFLEKGPVAGLRGMVNEKIAALLLGSGLDSIDDREKTAHTLKNFTVNISGTKGWKEAQVTFGGVSLGDINMDTMESKKVKNLFFAGEVLDYDGPCGGYNLNWAWKTGIKAGLGAAQG